MQMDTCCINSLTSTFDIMKGLKIASYTICVLIILMLVCFPLFSYYDQFGGGGVSNKPEDWAYFGDFVSGTVSAIIAFLSLIIISYLTFIVHKNSNHYLQKRIDAFDLLTSYTPRVVMFFDKMTRLMSDYNVEMSKLKGVKGINITTEATNFVNSKRNILDELEDELREYELFIFNFEIRYGHIFKYDFQSADYKVFKNTLKKMKESINPVFSQIRYPPQQIEIKGIHSTIDEHIKELERFTFDLRDQIK
jgi:hypothetical protein